MDQQLRYRLLVSDIDGTLVSDDDRLEKETIESIEEFRSAGGLFTLATGRNFPHTLSIIEQLQVDLPVILSDGAVLYDPVHRKKEIISSFTWEQLDQLVRQCKAISSQNEVFVFGCQKQTYDYCVYGVGNHPIIEKYASSWFYQYKVVPSFKTIVSEAYMMSVLVWIKEPNVIQQIQDWMKTHSDQFHFHFWMEQIVQVLPYTSTKGDAILSLCEHLQIAVEEVAAIGDQLNDLSMARTAGLFAAMENGDPLVKESAQLVVPKNNDLGVAHFIRQHLLAHQTGSN